MARKILPRFSIVLSLLILGLMPGPRAAASTMTVRGLGYHEYPVPLALDGFTPRNVVAGEIMVTLEGDNLLAYCIDLFTGLGFQTYSTTLGDPLGFSGGGRAAWIYDRYAADVETNASAASVQLALWDVVHDGGDGLGRGRIQLAASASGILRTVAEDMIDASAGQSSDRATILYNLSLANGARAQTLITSRRGPVPDIPHEEVPEPATFWLAGGALAGLYWLGRNGGNSRKYRA